MLNNSTYVLLIIFWGFLPIFAYSVSFSKEKETLLKNQQFGGWRFIFELIFFFAVGFFPAIFILICSSLNSPIDRQKIPILLISAIIVTVSCLFATWLRLSGYKYTTRLRDFLPFLCEIMGKNPPSESNEKPAEGKHQPTWIFKGCITLLAAVFFSVIALVYVLKLL